MSDDYDIGAAEGWLEEQTISRERLAKLWESLNEADSADVILLTGRTVEEWRIELRAAMSREPR